jgi:L-amino acid N-acyltransferase YncA
METGILLRDATPDDAAAIARIYNQGIEDRCATLETRLRGARAAPGAESAMRY